MLYQDDRIPFDQQLHLSLEMVRPWVDETSDSNWYHNWLDSVWSRRCRERPMWVDHEWEETFECHSVEIHRQNFRSCFSDRISTREYVHDRIFDMIVDWANSRRVSRKESDRIRGKEIEIQEMHSADRKACRKHSLDRVQRFHLQIVSLNSKSIEWTSIVLHRHRSAVVDRWYKSIDIYNVEFHQTHREYLEHMFSTIVVPLTSNGSFRSLADGIYQWLKDQTKGCPQAKQELYHNDEDLVEIVEKSYGFVRLWSSYHDGKQMEINVDLEDHRVWVLVIDNLLEREILKQ